MVLHVYSQITTSAFQMFRQQLESKLELQSKVDVKSDVRSEHVPLIVIAQNATRLGVDIDTATDELPDHIDLNKVAVVVFQVVAKHALPLTSPTSNLTDAKYKKYGLMVDFFFLPEVGIHKCDLNQQAMEKLEQFVQEHEPLKHHSTQDTGSSLSEQAAPKSTSATTDVSQEEESPSSLAHDSGPLSSHDTADLEIPPAVRETKRSSSAKSPSVLDKIKSAMSGQGADVKKTNLEKLRIRRDATRDCIERQLTKVNSGEIGIGEAAILIRIVKEKVDTIKALDENIINHLDAEDIRKEVGESGEDLVNLELQIFRLEASTAHNYITDHPRHVIPFLCKKFYAAGWMAGSGGALSVKHGDKIYTTPSGVQKELVEGDDLFVQTLEGDEVKDPPPEKRLKRSTCTPLITAVYKHQKGVGAVFHLHTMSSVMVSTITTGVGAVFHLHTMSSVMVSTITTGVELTIAHQNIIKVIKKSNSEDYFRSDGTLVVPIVENKPTEDQIKDSLVRAMEKYPETSAVLIRSHGMYVWAPTWQKAKIMAEAYDFLFDVAVRMTQLSLDPAAPHVPPEGAFT